MCISTFGPSSSLNNSLVILFIHSTFSLYFFGCHILVQNRLVSFAPVVDMFFVISSQSLIEFSFVVLEYPVLSILFYPLSISLKYSFFCQYFLVYFFKLYHFFLALPFSFLFLQIPASFLCCIILASFRRFLFVFPVEFPILVLIFFALFERILIFSQTNFAPA